MRLLPRLLLRLQFSRCVSRSAKVSGWASQKREALCFCGLSSFSIMWIETIETPKFVCYTFTTKVVKEILKWECQ